MKNNRWTLVAGLSLLVPPVFGLLYGLLFAREVMTTAFYPVPGLVLLPGFLVGPLAVVVPMVVFFAWNPGLFNGDSIVPKRSYVLLVVTTVLSVLWFIVGWRDGVAVQGAHYNYFVCGINVTWVSILWAIFIRSRKAEPSFKLNLLLHWFIFAWLAWYAFPFFGEIT
jgi:hypothetical protein